MKVPGRKAILKVGYACNNNCVFCHSAPHRGREATPEELRAKIGQAARLGVETLILSGGDPTIRKDLFEIAGYVRAAGMRLGLVTNGRMLAYRRLSERLAGLGLDFLQVSLSGPTPQVHDLHTRTESFKQTMQGLRNLTEIPKHFTINVCVTRWNLPHLQDIASLVAGIDGCRLKLSLLEPEGNALELFDELVPAPDQAAKAMVSAIADNRHALSICYDGLPRCLVPEDLWHLESGLRADGIVYMTEAFEREWYPTDDGNRGFADCCNDCSQRRACRGLYHGYLARDLASMLRPPKLRVPNSFLLEPWSDSPLDGQRIQGAAGCRIRAGELPPADPVRQLLVTGRGDRCSAYRVTSGDFSEEATFHTLHLERQVYRSRSSRATQGDISKHLVKLDLQEPCRDCPRLRLCSGVWQDGDGDAFSVFSQLLDEQLMQLSGSVLDVGCGAAPYLEGLADKIERGLLDYTGIDPRLPDTLPTGDEGRTRFFRTAVESFQSVPGGYDFVMAIRSLDHCESPATTLARLASWLRPGGRLLLVEDEVLAIVAGSTGEVAGKDDERHWEHSANLRLDEAMALARKAGLAPRYWRSARETGSPCWLLWCSRPCGVG